MLLTVTLLAVDVVPVELVAVSKLLLVVLLRLVEVRLTVDLIALGLRIPAKDAVEQVKVIPKTLNPLKLLEKP